MTTEMDAAPDQTRAGQASGDGPTSGVEIAPGLSVPESVLRFSFASSRGPGGQNVNKKATKAELRVVVDELGLSPPVAQRLIALAGRRVVEGGELIIVGDESRSQGQNKSACLERLRELLLQAKVKPKVRRATKPSRGSKERRLESKKARGEIKSGRTSRGQDD